MSTENIEITLTIFERCHAAHLAALADLPEAQANWKPAPDSRSIAEIGRHLVRVDGWFLQQMGFQPAAGDPGTNDPEAIRSALNTLREQVVTLLRGLADDQELRRERKAPDAERAFSLEYAVKHMSQHYLYHMAQIVYLRRAQDRAWTSPLALWEEAVDTISALTWKGHRD